MTVDLRLGDCLGVMPTLEANSIDTIITDPPYGLEFMGKDWDKGVPGIVFWKAALRVAKPGAIMLAFGGTRTFHRLTCAIEDAGWEIRDCMMWLYGSGFPKSANISKNIDKAKGAERETVGIKTYGNGETRPRGANSTHHEGYQRPWREADPQRTERLTAPATDLAREWDGWGTALKPAWEPILVAMKPCEGTFAENAEKWGVAGLNIDGARITALDGVPRFTHRAEPSINCYGDGKNGSNRTGEMDTKTGRFPANLLLDEEAAAMLDAQSGTLKSGVMRANQKRSTGGGYHGDFPESATLQDTYGDTGGASRFFYVAKASRRERGAGMEDMPITHATCRPQSDDLEERTIQERLHGRLAKNHHPTVKPLKLMEYLCLLTKTPTSGTVLDPFMGSGTTGVACVKLNRSFIGFEINPQYFEIAQRRIGDAQKQSCDG